MKSAIQYPKLTIITPNLNQGEFLEKCILSVINQKYPNLEFIVIDGGSSDNSVEIIKKYQNQLGYWVSEKDQGQADAINKGLAVATGKIFNWLNADDYLEPGALSKIAEAYHKHPHAAGWIGGCRRISNDRRLINVIYPNHTDRENIGQNWSGGQFYQPACFLNQSMVKDLGGVDPNLYCAMDLDLWIRLSASGKFEKTSGIIANALIHKEAKTQKSRQTMHQETAMVMKRNGFLEGARNRLEFASGKKAFGYIVPENLKKQLDCYPNSRKIERFNIKPKNIVFLSDHLPIYDIGSSANRIFHILKILAKNQIRVNYVYFSKIDNEDKYKRQFKENIDFIYIPLNLTRYQSYLTAIRPDCVWMTNFWDTGQFEFMNVLAHFIKNNVPTNLIVDTMDFHYKKYLRKYEVSHDAKDLVTANRFLELEKDLYPIADNVIVVSSEEKENIKENIKLLDKIEIIPNIHDICENTVPFHRRNHICFLGNFNVNHNVDAVKYFIENIFDKILDSHPHIEFHIMGSFSEQYRNEFESQNVKVLGHVENLNALFERYKLFVCPMTYGAGIKGKIGFAASTGLPFVTTTIGSEGFDLVDGEDCFIADDPAEFSAKCIQIIDDIATWSNFNLKSKLMILKMFSTFEVSKKIAQLFQNCPHDAECSEHTSQSADYCHNGPSEERLKISICIPTYNRSDFLNDCVQSALNQKYGNFEIVIVDDGSTDNTKQIVRSFKSDKIRYIKKEHEGAPQTRNRCIKEANGDYILWLDSDDILNPDILKIYQNTLIKFTDADILYCNLKSIDPSGQLKYIYKYNDWYENSKGMLAFFYFGAPVPNPGTLIAKRIFDEIGLYNEKFSRAHDFEFWKRFAFAKKFRAKHVNQVLYTYIIHNGNLTGELSEKTDFTFEKEIYADLFKNENLKDLFPEHNWEGNPDEAQSEAYYKIANRYAQMRCYPEAISFLEKCKQYRDSTEINKFLGMVYYLAGNYGRASKIFLMLQNYCPNDAGIAKMANYLIRISNARDYNRSI